MTTTMPVEELRPGMTLDVSGRRVGRRVDTFDSAWVWIWDDMQEGDSLLVKTVTTRLSEYDGVLVTVEDEDRKIEFYRLGDVVQVTA